MPHWKKRPQKIKEPTPHQQSRFTPDKPAKVEKAAKAGKPSRATATIHGLPIETILADPWLRLTNLYYIKDKDGNKVLFKPWAEQEELYHGMHNLNCILKARQRGMTTKVQIFMLDRTLFNKNMKAGIIAHSKEDAQHFFDDKIKFAFDNLPVEIRARKAAKTDNKNELKFTNGSSIRVGTSMRSATLQYLHVSEFGKICALYPDKAAEIVAGALNTVAKGRIVFIESTAEGAHGHFYKLCKRAMDLRDSGKVLTEMDYKFWFFPWWRGKEYALETPVDIGEDKAAYFEKLRVNEGIELTNQQKWWYVKKSEEQQSKMTQEYPSTPEEAFAQVVRGAVYGKEMAAVRKEGRICRVPWLPQYPVNTFWDLGRSRGNAMGVWCHQRVGTENRFIHYYEEEGGSIQSMAFYLLQLQGKEGFVFGRHYMPHDAGNTDLSQGEGLTRRQVAESMGVKPINVGGRIRVIEEGLNMMRQQFPSCWFDEKGCEKGIVALERYRYLHDDKRESYSPLPFHNWASNAADAIREFAQSFRPYEYRSSVGNVSLSRAARLKKRERAVEWRV